MFHSYVEIPEDIHKTCLQPRFARGESRISFDMLKPLRMVQFVCFPEQQTLKPSKTLKPKTLNPKLKPLNPEHLKSKSLRIASVFIHPL